MNIEIVGQLAKEYPALKQAKIEATLNLLFEDNTIPFIARYRKEMTGSMDEVMIKELFDRYTSLEAVMKRKEEVTRLIDTVGALNDEIVASIAAATSLRELEDIYRPYRPKRRTKATIAKEKGLEPLAQAILAFPRSGSLEVLAQPYAVEMSVEEALQGAHEIIAEAVSDDPEIRRHIRAQTMKNGVFTAKVKDKELDEKGIYEMYYDFSQPVKSVAPHRVLAVNRGESQKILNASIEVDPAPLFVYMGKKIIGDNYGSFVMKTVIQAYEDAYKRFIAPSIERELRNELTEKAHEQAIGIFGENLRNLLLQAPLKGKTVLGFDPAYRTGCKLAIVDKTGKVQGIEVIYPHAPAPKWQQEEALPKFKQIIEQYDVDLVAIGNGTASRESELFVSNALKSISKTVYYVIVNEAGASVYSASDVARKEFPDLEVEQRSAISIARRIQDPLAELVKIDPKSVGVGQYQHDVGQKALTTQLSFVVETAVNQVGVNLNTASPELLTHVSGLNKTLAQNVVNYRNDNGIFTSRSTLKKVPRLGDKAYQQAAGFLRVMESTNLLDKTGIHPESYGVTKALLGQLNLSLEDLGTEKALQALASVSLAEMATTLDIGKETLKDILDILKQPGRDYRDTLEAPLLRQDVLTLEDLKPGMELSGTVRNVVDFGAFVDIGVKQDGLVHISKLSNQFVKHPTDVVAVGDIVKVWVLDVDHRKQRVQLSMIEGKQ